MKVLIILGFFILSIVKTNGLFYRSSKNCNLRRDDESCLAVQILKVFNGTSVLIAIKNLENTGNQTVSLFGIDAGPLNKDYGIKSKEYLTKLLKNKKIKVVLKKGNYQPGHFVGIFYSGKSSINKKMIKDGYAWCLNVNICPNSYYKATLKAIKRKKGIWKAIKNSPSDKPNKSKNKTSNVSNGEYLVNMVKVVDGDTVYVRRFDSSDQSIIKVRMSGIDAPEMKQAYGMESKNKLFDIINNLNTNSLVISVSGTDKYGRSLAILKAENININKKLVEEGYAWCYRHTQCPVSYQNAMIEAKTQRKGLFSEANPTPPWQWRQENPRNIKN